MCIHRKWGNWFDIFLSKWFFPLKIFKLLNRIFYGKKENKCERKKKQQIVKRNRNGSEEM